MISLYCSCGRRFRLSLFDCFVVPFCSQSWIDERGDSAYVFNFEFRITQISLWRASFNVCVFPHPVFCDNGFSNDLKMICLVSCAGFFFSFLSWTYGRLLRLTVRILQVCSGKSCLAIAQCSVPEFEVVPKMCENVRVDASFFVVAQHLTFFSNRPRFAGMLWTFQAIFWF